MRVADVASRCGAQPHSQAVLALLVVRTPRVLCFAHFVSFLLLWHPHVQRYALLSSLVSR